MVATPQEPRSRLVGRRAETAAVRGLFEEAAQGRPGAMVVHGEAGIGKTRLVRDVCADVAGAGYEVLWGSCVRFGAASLSYAPVLSALDRWAARAHPALVERVFADAPQLRALLPSLGVRSDGPVPGTVLSWIDTALVRLARHAPTVLVIDDLQWADSASLDCLAYLVTGFGAERLGVVVTIRLDERPEGGPLHTWLADVRRLSHVGELTLERLDASETEEQIATLLPSPAAEEFVADVHDRSQGNAYLTELLVRNAASGDRRLPAGTPQALREAALARWHALSRPAREVTRLMAVGGRPVEHELVVAVTALALPSVDALDELLAEAVDKGVLRLGADHAYWFWHPLLAEVLVDTLDAARASPLHATYAAVLEAHAGDRPGPLAADLAAHHAAAGHVDAAFRWSLVAADHAAHLKATAEASEHLSRACSLWPSISPPARAEAPDQVTLLRRAAEVAGAVGDFRSAHDLLDTGLRIVDREADPLTASALLVAWTRADWHRSPGQFWYRAEMDTAIALTAHAPDSAEAAFALARLAMAKAWDETPAPGDPVDSAGQPLAGGALAAAALAAAHRSGSDLALSHALTAYAVVTLLDPAVDVLGVLEEAHSLAAGTDPTWAAEVAIWQFNRLDGDGRLPEAALVAVRASAAALSAGSSHYGHFLAGLGAAMLLELGRWDEAHELIRPAVVGGAGISGAMARCDAAVLAVRRGNLPEALRHLERVAELVAPDFEGAPITETTVEVMQGCGELERALAYLDDRWHLAYNGVDLRGLDPLLAWGATVCADLSERARDHGDPVGSDAAIAALDALVARREALPGTPFTAPMGAAPVGRVDEARFEAESRRCRGEPGQADAWRRLREQAGAEGLVWHETVAAWRQGQALLSEHSTRDAAAEALRAAHARAVRLGARPLREEVESLARAAHIPLEAVDDRTAPFASEATGHPATPRLAVLTDREQQVLDRVVAGRSNGEIARELFISAKTVSVHVSNILHKSGTTTRVEAAAWARRVGERDDQ